MAKAAKAAAKPAAASAKPAAASAKPAAAAPPKPEAAPKLVATNPAAPKPANGVVDLEAAGGSSISMEDSKRSHDSFVGKQPKLVLMAILLIVLSCVAAAVVALYFVMRGNSSSGAGRRSLSPLLLR